MNCRFTMWVLARIGCVAFLGSVLSSSVQADGSQAFPSTPQLQVPINSAAVPTPTHRANPVGQQQKETITLEIRGANSHDDAHLLCWTLMARRVSAEVEESPNQAYRITAAIDPGTDLGAAGEAVLHARTADNTASPPSLSLVLFGNFDPPAAQRVTDALGKIAGVDAKDSSVLPAKREITVRIPGGAKVTADQIRKALHDAGVDARFTRNEMIRHA